VPSHSGGIAGSVRRLLTDETIRNRSPEHFPSGFSVPAITRVRQIPRAGREYRDGVEPSRALDDRARADSRVVWAHGGTLRNARVILGAIIAVVAAIGLIDLLVASGALHLFG
jgi:hypothetical protein